MLYVRLLLENYDRVSTDVRCDLYVALRDGYKTGALSSLQITAIYLLTQGFNALEISTKLNTDIAEHLTAAIRFISTYLNYKDEHVIYARKGEIKQEWLLKAQTLAESWY